MRFECNRKELREKLGLVSKIIPEKGVKEGLNSILITGNPPNGICLYGTNMDTSIEVLLAMCEIDQNDSFLVPAKLFKDIVDSLNVDVIRGSVDDKILTIMSEATIYHIPTQNMSSYPVTEQSFSENGISIDFNAFKTAIKSVVPFVDKSSYKPILSGVLFDLREDELRIVATDANRLAVYKLGKDYFKFLGYKFTTEVVLPVTPLNIITEAKLDGSINIRFGDSALKIEAEDMWIVSSLIDGNFPKYESVIPTEFVASATVDRNDLKTSIKKVIPICRNNNNAVRITIKENQLTLSAKSPVGLVSDKIPAQTNGNDFDIVFDARYIEDFLSLGNWPVNIEFSEKTSPARFTFSHNQDIIYVAMPMAEEE